jgi:thiol-disulfide isomerase/thioredoxin
MAGRDRLSRRAILGQASGAACALMAPKAWAQSAPAAEAAAPALPAIGTDLKLPVVELLNGQVFRPDQASGQVLVVYWWASWCPFCALQSPEMEKLWRAHSARGLQLLALSIDRKREDAAGYLAKKGYTFPAGLVTPDITRALPKPKGLPVTLVRGRNGRVVLAEAGQLFPEDVAAIAAFL